MAELRSEKFPRTTNAPRQERRRGLDWDEVVAESDFDQRTNRALFTADTTPCPQRSLRPPRQSGHDGEEFARFDRPGDMNVEPAQHRARAVIRPCVGRKRQ